MEENKDMNDKITDIKETLEKLKQDIHEGKSI
jgi:hypothetical protein